MIAILFFGLGRNSVRMPDICQILPGIVAVDYMIVQ